MIDCNRIITGRWRFKIHWYNISQNKRRTSLDNVFRLVQIRGKRKRSIIHVFSIAAVDAIFGTFHIGQQCLPESTISISDVEPNPAALLIVRFKKLTVGIGIGSHLIVENQTGRRRQSFDQKSLANLYKPIWHFAGIRRSSYRVYTCSSRAGVGRIISTGEFAYARYIVAAAPKINSPVDIVLIGIQKG